MGLSQGVGDVLWALAGPCQEDAIGCGIQRSQLGMHFHEKAIRAEGEFQKVSEALSPFRRDKTRRQDHKIGLFFIGLAEESVFTPKHDLFPPPEYFRGYSLFIDHSFFLYPFVEFFVSLSKGPYIDVENHYL